jgi:hypothetical protein
MPYLRWFLLSIASLVGSVLSLFLAPILALLANDEGFLPRWLVWFQTLDNSLDGDEGWRKEHWQWRFRLPSALSIYVGRVGWLWRNPFYGFDLLIASALIPQQSPDNLVIHGDPQVQDKPHGREGYCYVSIGGWWSLTLIKRLPGSTKCIKVVAGWSLKTLAENPWRVAQGHHVLGIDSWPIRITGFRQE